MTSTIVFFTRAGCSLCAEGRAVVARVCAGRQWQEIDVDDDAALQAAYGEFVPVVEVDGRRVAQWRIDEARLREAIAGAEEKESAPRRSWWRRRAR